MPNDNRVSYVTSHRITDKYSLFSKPYKHWHLDAKDEKVIDIFEFRKKNKTRPGLLASQTGMDPSLWPSS